MAEYLRRLWEDNPNEAREKRARDYARAWGAALVNHARAMKKAAPPVMSAGDELTMNWDRYKVCFLLQACCAAADILLLAGFGWSRGYGGHQFCGRQGCGGDHVWGDES